MFLCLVTKNYEHYSSYEQDQWLIKTVYKKCLFCTDDLHFYVLLIVIMIDALQNLQEENVGGNAKNVGGNSENVGNVPRNTENHVAENGGGVAENAGNVNPGNVVVGNVGQVAQNINVGNVVAGNVAIQGQNVVNGVANEAMLRQV